MQGKGGYNRPMMLNAIIREDILISHGKGVNITKLKDALDNDAKRLIDNVSTYLKISLIKYKYFMIVSDYKIIKQLQENNKKLLVKDIIHIK